MVSKRSQEPVMLWELVWFMALVAVGNQILGWNIPGKYGLCNPMVCGKVTAEPTGADSEGCTGDPVTLHPSTMT